jgi:hypothetical protein
MHVCVDPDEPTGPTPEPVFPVDPELPPEELMPEPEPMPVEPMPEPEPMPVEPMPEPSPEEPPVGPMPPPVQPTPGAPGGIPAPWLALALSWLAQG